MKNLNNKGFAISTLLYGIMIMIFLIVFALMSIMGSNRKNTKNLVDIIDEELNRFALVDVTFKYDSNVDGEGPRRYIVQSSGWYKIELWGAKNSSTPGSYSSGIIYLDENRHLYVYLGNQDVVESYITLSSDNPDETTIIKTSNDKLYMLGYAGTEAVQDDAGRLDTGKTIVDSDAGLESITPIFYDGMVVPKVNSGVSQFRITKISENRKEENPITKINSDLENVRYIRDCVTGSSHTTYGAAAHWSEIQAISNGTNIAKWKYSYATVDGIKALITSNSDKITNGSISISNGYGELGNSTAEKCVIIDLGTPSSLDEIAVWHYYSDNRSYYNHVLSVGPDLENLKTLRSTYYNPTASINTSEKENYVGIRYSSYQPVPSTDSNLEEGRYYIFYVGDVDKNTVITDNGSNLSVSLFQAEKNQQWQVTKNPDGTYKITNVETGKSLEKSGNNVICNNKNFTDNQKWKIVGYPAGFFSIQDPTTTGPFYVITNGMSISPPGYADTQRFRFVKVYG